MHKVSIIIPVYNVKSDYMKVCVESVINQTYSNIEIIIVDDGSTNDAGSLCDEFAKRDERIKVLHTENQGVSIARNYGVQKSHGEYIMFVDSDDIVSKYMVERAVNNVERSDADIVLGLIQNIYDFSEFKENRSNEEYCIDSKETLDELHKIFFDISTQDKLYNIEWNGVISRGPYAKLVKAELAKKVKFPEGILYGEDAVWIMRLLNASRKIVIVNEIWYGYLRYGESSIYRYSEKTIRSYEIFLKLILEENKPFFSKHPRALYINLYTELVILIRYHFLAKECTLSVKEKKAAFREIATHFEKKYLVGTDYKKDLKLNGLLIISKNGLWIPAFSLWGRIRFLFKRV